MAEEMVAICQDTHLPPPFCEKLGQGLMGFTNDPASH